MGLERVAEMIAAGVDTFKIEGRLKGPEYVYLTTRAYRAAVDAAWSQGELRLASLEGSEASEQLTAAAAAGLVPTRSELAQVFARGQDGSHDGLTTG
jgi:collagenase-like PrtC family protease